MSETLVVLDSDSNTPSSSTSESGVPYSLSSTSNTTMDSKFVEDMDQTPTSPSAPKRPVKIRYTADCLYLDGPDFLYSVDDKPLSLSVSTEPTPEVKDEPDDSPVLEIFTSMEVTAIGEAKPSEETTKKQTFDDKRIMKIGSSRMVVHSSRLSKIIRDVVEYYPSQNLTGDTITIREPYGVLIHHFKELKAVMAELAEAEKTDENQIKREHLQILLDYMQPYIQRNAPIQKRLAQETPTVSFDDIWYVLRPGSIAYAKWENEWLGCVIDGAAMREADEDTPQRWAISMWFVDTSWHSGEVGAASATIYIDKFDGEREVKSLPIFPREYWDMQDGGKRRAKFETRGQKILDILWKGYEYMNYDGELMDKSKQRYKGQIIVSSTQDFGDDFPTHGWDFSWAAKLPLDQKEAETKASPNLIRKLQLEPSKDGRESVTTQHLFLTCPAMCGFSLSTKKWTPIHIDHTRDLETEDQVPEAIIGPEKMKIIKALSDYQTRAKKPWSADFIKNKGDGVVVLLHGPPGVGKTYTVETTALRTRRPLITLTIAEIGTKEEKVEAELTRWFALAQKWQAILLIDECDIFLERREHADIARNGVVSAFLRKMEYFGGLLFLTTNRVGHIDDAFMSRVHVIIGFDKLDPSKRTLIWRSLLEKLARERKSQIRVSNGAKKFLESGEMRTMEWNGREIRNAFQTAIALAEYEARESPDYEEGEEIIVEAEQFREVMDMNKTFRAYLDSIRIQDEGERAKAYQWRNDYFNPAAN